MTKDFLCVAIFTEICLLVLHVVTLMLIHRSPLMEIVTYLSSYQTWLFLLMTSTDLITGFVQVLALCTPNHGIVASLMTQQGNNLPAMQETRDMSLILGSGRSPRGGNGKPFQYSCLGNPVDRGAWWAAAPWGCKELDTTE